MLLTIFKYICRGIAQLVEQRSPKPRAEGSNPSAPAKSPLRKQGALIFSTSYCTRYKEGKKMNIVEQNHSYEIDLEFSYFDENGYLTPYGYQYVVNCVADKHLLMLNMNFEKSIVYGVSWVILSLTVDIVNPIKGRDKKIIGKTWYSQHKGLFHRREVRVEDEDGLLLFNCATYSTLIDLKTHSIYRNRTLPFELMPPTDELILDAKPTFKEKLEFESGETQKVRRSHIDGLGHVNNGKYSNFCFDAFNDEQADLKKLRRMEIYFVNEMRLGEEFSTNKLVDGDRLVLQGYNKDTDKPSFYGVFYYN